MMKNPSSGQSPFEKRDVRLISPSLAEIDAKLRKEKENLAILEDTLKKNKAVNESVNKILLSFEDRLGNLEKTILPVYNETSILQRRQHNLESVLGALDNVIGYHSVSRDVEYIIKDGPGGRDLHVFIEAMDRLFSAVNYFEKNNPSSVELENVATLFENGTGTLCREFREILTRYSNPVNVRKVINLINDEESEVSLRESLPVSNLPEKAKCELKEISGWLTRHGKVDHVNVYARIRSNIVVNTVVGIKDQMKKESGSHGNSGRQSLSNVVFYSSNKGNRKVDLGMSKIQKMIEKKASMVLNKASKTIESSRRPSAVVLEDLIADYDIETFLISLSGFLKLMMSEKLVMQGIIPDDHMCACLDMIGRDSLEYLAKEGESLCQRAKKLILRQDFIGVLSLLPILKHVTTQLTDFDSVLFQEKTKLKSLVSGMSETVSGALDEVINRLKTDQDRHLPHDGTVHELTSNTLVFLEQLLDYKDILAPLMSQDQCLINSTRFISADKDLQDNMLLGAYLQRVLSTLGLNLFSKSEGYGDSHLRPIFRLNNYQYILSAVQRTAMLTTLSAFEKGCEENYQDLVLEQKRLYSQSWSRVLHYIVGTDIPLPVLQAGKLKDKDRAFVKDKFTGFNKEIEDLTRTQRNYSIPDPELRESLKRDNKEYILPKYQAFHDRYSNVGFSKNLDKYVKYTPVDVSQMIDTFFDVTA